jgi:hypothetical protein
VQSSHQQLRFIIEENLRLHYVQSKKTISITNGIANFAAQKEYTGR